MPVYENVANITKGINILAWELQETQWVVLRFSSTRFLESIGPITLKGPFLVLNFKTTYYINIFSF